MGLELSPRSHVASSFCCPTQLRPRVPTRPRGEPPDPWRDVMPLIHERTTAQTRENKREKKVEERWGERQKTPPSPRPALTPWPARTAWRCTCPTQSALPPSPCHSWQPPSRPARRPRPASRRQRPGPPATRTPPPRPAAHGHPHDAIVARDAGSHQPSQPCKMDRHDEPHASHHRDALAHSSSVHRPAQLPPRTRGGQPRTDARRSAPTRALSSDRPGNTSCAPLLARQDRRHPPPPRPPER